MDLPPNSERKLFQYKDFLTNFRNENLRHENCALALKFELIGQHILMIRKQQQNNMKRDAKI